MTDSKLSNLPAITSVSDDDLMYVVDDPAGASASSKITFAGIQDSITKVNSGITSGLALISSGTLGARQIVPGSAKIDVTNGSGVAGNPTVDLGSVSLADLTDGSTVAAIASVASGIVTVTGPGTAEGRTITGTANQITVADGDGVSGNPTLSLATGIDATKIGAGTVTSTEFGYLSSVTSDIQTQLDGKATTNATLTALAAYNTDGLMTQTAANTFTGRTITGTSSQITVSNGSGVAGNPTLSLASNARLGVVGATKDGGGVALTTGKVGGYATVPYSGTISAWSIGVDTGTITFKVWKVASGTAVPTSGNSINTSGVALSSNTYIRSTTLTDFTTTTVTANDIFAFNIEAVASATQATFTLEITRT